jgi:protein-tyrosine phosphatase
MPGRNENLEQSFQAMQEQKISRIVCLTSLDEVRVKSSDYYHALAGGKIPWPVEECPVPDFEGPEDEDTYVKSVRRTSELLRNGERILVHCAGGKGRTGTYAVCTLIRLGMPVEVAHKIVNEAESHPETDVQRDFIRRVTPRLQSI